jgi:hypothetical protein
VLIMGFDFYGDQKLMEKKKIVGCCLNQWPKEGGEYFVGMLLLGCDSV